MTTLNDKSLSRYMNKKQKICTEEKEYSMIGKEWSAQDDTVMQDMWRQGKSVEDISVELGRPPEEVDARAFQFGFPVKCKTHGKRKDLSSVKCIQQETLDPSSLKYIQQETLDPSSLKCIQQETLPTHYKRQRTKSPVPEKQEMTLPTVSRKRHCELSPSSKKRQKIQATMLEIPEEKRDFQWWKDFPVDDHVPTSVEMMHFQIARLDQTQLRALCETFKFGLLPHEHRPLSLTRGMPAGKKRNYRDQWRRKLVSAKERLLLSRLEQGSQKWLDARCGGIGGSGTFCHFFVFALIL